MLKQLCRGDLIKLPVAVLIEINWQGHWTALWPQRMGREERKMAQKPKGGENTENNNSDDNIQNYVRTTARAKHKHSLGVYSDRHAIPN